MCQRLQYLKFPTLDCQEWASEYYKLLTENVSMFEINYEINIF